MLIPLSGVVHKNDTIDRSENCNMTVLSDYLLFLSYDSHYEVKYALE